MQADQGDGASGGPTAPRLLLGVRLRRLREERGLSRSKAAHAIRASDSKIGRMELGRSPFKERDVSDLLTLYGVDAEPDREQLLLLARRSAKASWWQEYGDLISAGDEHYLGLEEAARLVRVYEPQLVPDLLQIDRYARTITRLRYPAEHAGEIERRVRLRSERQERFFRTPEHRLWAVLDEAVLRRAWGSTHVLRSQLRHLLNLSTLRNVTIQIVPFSAVSSLGPGVRCTQFRFSEQELPDVVHLDQATGAYYIDKPEDSDHFGQSMLMLAGAALTPERSRDLLNKIFEQA